MNIYSKLEKAKYSFHQQEITKTGKNTFAKYDYLQLADIVKPIINSLHENGLVSFVSFGIDLATLTVVDIETEKELLITSPMSTAALKGCHAVQNLGAVQTYIRRYLYCALFDIVEGDAIDGSQPLNENTKEAPTEAKVSVQQLAAAMKAKGITDKQIFATYKKETSKSCSDLKFLPQEYKVKYLAMCK